MNNLSKLFSPNSIGVYGVSENPNKLGSIIFQNLINSGFEGKLYPINPKYKSLKFNRANLSQNSSDLSDQVDYICYSNASEIGSQIDLALISLPVNLVEGVFLDCKNAKVPNIIIVTAGFSEVGDAGKLIEGRIAQLARENNINLLGPNCLGLIVPGNKMNASFARSNNLDGRIAFISQSGAICSVLLDKAAKDKFGFSHFVSIGNKPVIEENILISEFLSDDKVKIIGAYLEEFENGETLVKLKDSFKIEKPIVILAPGEFEEAKGAIQSHTGSIASPKNIISAAFEKYGITEVNEVNDLYNTLLAFDLAKDLANLSDVTIVTNAGGVGIVAVDSLIRNGLLLSKISDDLERELEPFLPAEASLQNPIDLIGDATSERYKNVLDTLIRNPEHNTILVIITPQLVTDVSEICRVIVEANQKSGSLIVPVLLGGENVSEGLQILRDNKSLGFNSLEEGIRVISHLKKYSDYLKRSKPLFQPNLNKRRLNLSKTSKDLEVLSDRITHELISEFEIDIPESKIIGTDESELLETYSNFKNKKVVLKALTQDLPHKIDFKGVYVNIKSEAELLESFNLLKFNVSSAIQKEASGFLLQEMLSQSSEMFIGIKRDNSFGYSIALGSGGTFTELYNDFAYSLLPLSESEIVTLITKTKFNKIINGFRGSNPLSMNQIVQTIIKIQKMVMLYTEIHEVDINPLMVSESFAKVADIKIYI